MISPFLQDVHKNRGRFEDGQRAGVARGPSFRDYQGPGVLSRILYDPRGEQPHWTAFRYLGSC